MAVVSKKAIILVIVLAGSWMVLPLVQAQIYKWTDPNGVIHFVDDLSKIPPEYRDKIEKEYQFKEKRPEINIEEKIKEEKKEEKQERRPN